MRLSEFLNEEVIKVGLEAQDKHEVFEELVDVLVRSGRVADRQAALKALWNREQLQSTGIGGGLAVPHGKDPSVNRLSACLGISRNGFDYQSLDGQAVRVVFLLLAQKNNPGLHLEALTHVAELFSADGFMQNLLKVRTPKEVLTVLREYEEHVYA
jgi:fructose-specific phosphotransferase system IIA component